MRNTTTVSDIKTDRAGSIDSIEVIDENNGLWARVRVREQRLGKASIYLTPSELEQHGRACIALAEDMKARR